MDRAVIAQKLESAVGFRNIAVHNYSLVNWQTVHVIISQHLSDFDVFARAISDYQNGLNSSPS